MEWDALVFPKQAAFRVETAIYQPFETAAPAKLQHDQAPFDPKIYSKFAADLKHFLTMPVPQQYDF